MVWELFEISFPLEKKSRLGVTVDLIAECSGLSVDFGY